MPKVTLSFKGRLLKVYPLTDGDITIGRDPGCDIHVDSLAVSPLHARIRTDNATSTIEDMESAGGVLVNECKVERQALQARDVIQIGKHTLLFEDVEVVTSEPDQSEAEPASSFSPAPPAPPAWLQVLRGPHVGKTVKLKSALTDIGKLGMRPALISRRGNGYYIASLDDSVPISVAGKDIGTETCPLHDGDIIQIGDMQIQFYLQPADAHASVS